MSSSVRRRWYNRGMSTAVSRIKFEDLRARKPEALKALVDENLPKLMGGALAIGISREDAEEAVQDTFVAFLSGLERFEGRSSLSTYLFGILYHKASNLRAKARRTEGTDDIEAVLAARFDAGGLWLKPPRGPEAEALDAETRRLVEACAEGLPDAQRAAFFLKEVDGAEPEDICNVLGVSPTNLRVMLHRARLRLRECLELNWGKDGR